MDTLIYIDDKERLDASVAANAFAHKDVKNRAYINTLGAELALKYLASEDIDVSNTKNLHNIKKILEETDISDIMLENIHIDVRVVFDENAIFIPKSHFKYELTPDIYLVFNLVEDHSHVRFLGFFEPKLINKNNANSDYYFIEKEKLSSPNELVNYIKTHHGNTNRELSDDDMENSERIIVSMSDNDISENDKKYLIKQLLKSAELRDKFIEYENFETLSYKAMNDPHIEKKEIINNNIEDLDSEFSQTQDDFADAFSVDENMPEETTLDELEPINDTLEDIVPEEPIADLLEDTLAEESIGNEFGDVVSEPLQPENTDEQTDTIGLDEISSLAENIIPEEIGIDALALDNIELPQVEENNIASETVSFDALDTTNLENIEIPESVEEDTVSLDALDVTNLESVEMPESVEENTVSLDALDVTNLESIEMPETVEEDTVSLDTLDVTNLENIEMPKSVEEDTVSLDALDVTNLENIEMPKSVEEDTVSLYALDVTNLESIEMPETVEEDTVSLDTLDVTNLENIEMPKSVEEDTVSLDALDVTNLENIEMPKSVEEDTVSLDALDVASLETVEVPQTFDAEAVSLDELDTTNLEDSNTEPIDTSNFENIENIETLEEKESPEIPNNTELESIDSIENVITNELPDVIFPEDTKISEKNDDDSSFGKNLLENLSSVDDIEIANTENQDSENISSNDLLAQIDDVLSSSSSVEEDLTENNIENIDNLLNEEDKLNVLYNETDLDTPIDESLQEEGQEELPQVPGAALYNKKSDNKRILTAAILITILAASTTFMFLKPKNNNDIEPIDPAATTTTPIMPEQNNDILANTPEKAVSKDIQTPKPPVKELKNTPPKPVKSELSLNVNRLVWDVPDTLSYSPRMQNYLKTAGKSIKLSLSADLLLATEYAYTNQVKVGLKLGNGGAVQDARILSGSGSTQIDNIVLQSVKDTLNVVKPPSDEIKTPDFNLNLIIYF